MRAVSKKNTLTIFHIGMEVYIPFYGGALR